MARNPAKQALRHWKSKLLEIKRINAEALKRERAFRYSGLRKALRQFIEDICTATVDLDEDLRRVDTSILFDDIERLLTYNDILKEMYREAFIVAIRLDARGIADKTIVADYKRATELLNDYHERILKASKG